MINQSTKLAEELFKTTQPEVCKAVTDVLVKHATSRDVTLVVTYLMETIKTYKKGCRKVRNRSFRKEWIEVLDNLNKLGDGFHHRLKFLTKIGANDFSLMKYWDLIEDDQTHKGFWKITDMGKLFLKNTLAIPPYKTRVGIGHTTYLDPHLGWNEYVFRSEIENKEN